MSRKRNPDTPYDYRVHVIGPGGCIQDVMDVVEKALRDAGLDVVIDNDHPTPQAGDPAGSMRAAAASEHGPDNVLLKAVHCPWGA